MVPTFRNIRLGLMVGVRADAPKPPRRRDPQQDIRLGDVVSQGGAGKYLVAFPDRLCWEPTLPLGRLYFRSILTDI